MGRARSLVGQALHALQALVLSGWTGWSLNAHPTGTAGYVGRQLSSVAGPFRTVVERFERCGGMAASGADVDPEDAVVVNVTRVSRQRGPRGDPQRLTGNLTLRQTLDDSSSTVLTIDQWSNNQWKRNAFIMRLPGLCSALRDFGLLGGGLCPALQGDYHFEDLSADWQFESMPQFYYGTWRAEAVFSREGVRRGCVRLLFKTSPAWPDDWPGGAQVSSPGRGRPT